MTPFISQEAANIGLAVFVLTIAVDAGALIFDVGLQLLGWPMITTQAREHAWFAGLILLFQLVGVAGLAVHFMHVTTAKGLFR